MTYQKPNVFRHNFNTPGAINIDEMKGFANCMNEVYNHIESVTNYDPTKRFIDSVALLSKIEETNKEFGKILEKERLNLERIK